MVVKTPGGNWKSRKKITWEIVAVVGMFFLFTYGMVSLAAQHFDLGEWKAVLGITAASAARETAPYIFRAIKRFLGPTTEAFSRGGQVE